MFPFIETMQLIGSNLSNLEFHQARIDEVFKNFYPNYPSLSLQNIQTNILNNTSNIKKCRLLYNHHYYNIQISDYNPAIFNQFYLMECKLNYKYKYYDRLLLEHIKSNLHADIEIILTSDGLINDTSYANIVFYDGTRWTTPSNCLLKGTTRSRLLSENKIVEEIIKIEDLKLFRSFKLINALNNFEETTEYSISKIYML